MKNKTATKLHSLFGKRGAIQCGLSKERWLGKTEKGKRAKRYEIDTPLNRVLRAESVSEKLKRRFVGVKYNIKIATSRHKL